MCRPSGDTRTRRSWLASPGAPSIASVRDAHACAHRTRARRPCHARRRTSVSPSGVTAMPSAPCGMAMVPDQACACAISTTATASLRLERCKQLVGRMADRDPMRRRRRSDALDRAACGSIASTALPSSPVDHKVPRASSITECGAMAAPTSIGCVERFGRKIDHRDAAVGIYVLAEDAAAIDRRVDLRRHPASAPARASSRHVDIGCERQSAASKN